MTKVVRVRDAKMPVNVLRSLRVVTDWCKAHDLKFVLVKSEKEPR